MNAISPHHWDFMCHKTEQLTLKDTNGNSFGEHRGNWGLRSIALGVISGVISQAFTHNIQQNFFATAPYCSSAMRAVDSAYVWPALGLASAASCSYNHNSPFLGTISSFLT